MKKMSIVVCIKQVPDTTEIKLDPVTGTMIREGVPSIMNPDDKSGLEMALELKDKYEANVNIDFLCDRNTVNNIIDFVF